MRYVKVWMALVSFLISFHGVGEGLARADSVSLAPFNHGASIDPTTIQVDGQDAKVWQTSPQDHALTLKPTGNAIAPAAGTLYLEVTYLDKGYGRLTVTYPGSNGSLTKPDKFTRVVLSDSGKWVTSYQRLSGLPNAGIPDIQISVEKDRKNPLSMDNILVLSKAAIQNTPFTDPHFQYIVKEAWKRPYDGPTTPGIDNKTLKGKIMVGYQGWFRTPNDPWDQGWVHWGDMNKGNFTTDIWPDTSAYPPEALDKAGDVKTLSGKPGYLFSPAWPEVVQIHFSWMRQNNIDGAFAQRFIGHLANRKDHTEPEWVLDNVRAAANQEGRIWAVEYDVSGCPDDKLLETLKNDWVWMVDTFGIKKDPAYAHEDGKPVVFIWGMAVQSRHITSATADAVVDFFKNDPTYGGNYVIGGLPGDWRKLNDSWQQHFRKYDSAQPWMSTSYAEDMADFKRMGVQYYPHVKPGFSWANLKHLPTGSSEGYTARDGGRFYEGLFSKACQAGIDRLFVGMFDEYDEGTAIMPISDDPPPTPKLPGTTVKLFANPKEQERPLVINKPQVELALDGTAPDKKIPPENFLMRWEGQIVPPADGRYQFEIEGAPGDSCSLSIDGKKILNIAKLGEGDAKIGAVTLTVAQPSIYRLDYLHGSAHGVMRLMWTGPSIERQEVPATAFFDAWGRFVSNEGHPSDWWLKLTAEAKDMLTGKRSPTDLSIK